MIDRLLLAMGILAGGLLAARLVSRAWLAWRARRHLGLPQYRPGTAAILYFTSPGCAPCESVQAPTLNRLRALYGGGLQVIMVDATQEPRLADSWGVLGVPTTFLIDSGGRPRAVNHGVARAQRLIRQLADLGLAAPVSDPEWAEAASVD